MQQKTSQLLLSLLCEDEISNCSLSILWYFPSLWLRLFIICTLTQCAFFMPRRLFLIFPSPAGASLPVNPSDPKQNTLKISFKCFSVPMPCKCFAALSSVYFLCLKIWCFDTCLILSSLSWRMVFPVVDGRRGSWASDLLQNYGIWHSPCECLSGKPAVSQNYHCSNFHWHQNHSKFKNKQTRICEVFFWKKAMESRLSACPSSHLPDMSQENSSAFSSVGLKQALELASGMGERKASSRKEVLYLCFINTSISGKTV